MPRPLPTAAALCLLLAASAAVQAEEFSETNSRGVDAVEIFRCSFDEKWDRNYDLWPDKWKRETGPEYPHYVRMEIAEDDELEEGRCLEIGLDGSQAKVSCPPIRVLPKFSYTLELKLKLTNIEHSAVTVVMEFMTAKGEVVQTHRSEPFTASGDWQDVKIGKFRPGSELVDRVVAHIEVARGDRGDLQGLVSVADVWLGRWPSMEVTTNSRINVYNDPDNVVVTCSLSGISEKDPLIKFQLLDATQAEIGEEGVKKLEGRLISEEARRASDILAGDGRHSKGYEGSEDWRPDIKEHGFYRVRVQMISNETKLEMDKRIITLAVVPKAVLTSIGEFGWSLPETVPRLGQPLDFATLQELLPMAGVSWVKLPVWFPREHQERGDRIIQFAERLAATDIETIGVLQEPDHTPDGPEPVSGESSIEFIFRKDPSTWLPLFDHVMNRLSLRIRWWQLGYDHDTSFVGHEDLVGKIRDIRQQLYRFGQDVRLGLGWRWDELPIGGELSWDFEQLSSDPPLQSEQLDSELATRPTEGAPRWVLIEPVIDSGRQDLSEREKHEARVREFIKQIIVAKKHGVDGIYIPKPFSGPDGVMNTDGTPGELLLPWRTSAMLLGGAKFMGSLQLPSGSKNWLFIRPDRRVVMVAWNEQPCDEVLYLGDNVLQIDVWGKQRQPANHEHRQVIPVGPEPTFVLGVSEHVARWRMSVAFEKTSVPSVFGVEHENALLMRNEFPAGIGGTVSLFVPDLLQAIGPSGEPRPSGEWKIFPPEGDIKGPANVALRRPLQIELSDAAYGEQPIRIDFEVYADKLYKFSVWRSLSVGAGDIDIQAVSFLDDDGRLIVQQRMQNLNGPYADFKCLLYAPLRRRKRTQVFQLGAEPDIKTYTYSAGEDLLGKDINLMLRIEEIDGDRVLIYRFPAQRESDILFDAGGN
ncbi:hypothetical protein KOR34_23100 [Posidoniimonas corsicana]|uniref:Uncharacterized protein n=1 Tax=Posidoniimonas corsicana TaxID=1938618 RepID=A0A5C5VGX8_9BACT|nr:hypothetical protein [Posidoniimonas corsicana]TWT37361.1 hypothetical protein KOR34_23100 [Posidoniimonas corsicana]